MFFSYFPLNAGSGLGLVIGSIGFSVVQNITFRDCYLPNTVKGIYMKTRWSDSPPQPLDVASITDILFENITMDAPEQFSMYILVNDFFYIITTLLGISVTYPGYLGLS